MSAPASPDAALSGVKSEEAFRRLVRDLVALSALPASFRDREPEELAGAMASTVLSLLRVDAVFVRLTHPDIRDASATAAPDTDSERNRALKDLAPRVLDRSARGEPFTLDGLRCWPAPVGHAGRDGLIVAASSDPEFPAPGDRLLLNVAANHAAVLVESARRQKAVRSLNAELEARVRERTRELEASESRFRSIVGSIPGAVYRCDARPPWAVHYMSDAVLDITGCPAEDFLNGRLTWAPFVHPDDTAAVVEALQVAEARNKPYHLEYRVPRRDGTLGWVLDRGYFVYDDAGRPTFVEGVVLDISEKKRAEEALKARGVELEELVRELERFAYTIAHDLRAPLRGIHRYSDLLEQEHAASLGEEGKLYAQRISSAAKRMDRLIEDLLAYSRVARGKIQLGAVDLQLVLSDVLRTLESDIRERRAELRVEGRLPKVYGDPVLLSQALMNLLSNALKFVAPGQAPRVAVGSQERDGRARVFVRDQGIGIAPEQASRLFHVFERLHSPADYPGTGIGLAIVKRAMERIGGAVELESAPGRGTTFWIDIPLMSRAPEAS